MKGDAEIFLNGILFGNYIIAVFIGILCFYSMTNTIVSIERDNKLVRHYKKNKEGHKLKDIVQVIVKIGEMLFLFIAGFYYVIKYQVKPIIICFIILAFIWWLILIPYIFWDFVRYVFVTPDKYDLTKERENTLFLAGFLTCFICAAMVENKGEWGQQFSVTLPLIVKDFISMVGLTFWYFSVCFFLSSFTLLALHKIIVCICRGNDTIAFKKGKRENKVILFEPHKITYHLKIDAKFEGLKRDKIWKKIGYYFGCVVWVVAEPILIFVEIVIEFTWNLCTVFIKITYVHSCNIARKLLNVLNKNQGKTIIVFSRLSLVASLLAVYLIDKYKGVLSPQGSEIYEFICSVMLIPLFITQLVNLKKQTQNSN